VSAPANFEGCSPGEWPASEADAKKGHEAGWMVTPEELSPHQSGSGGQPAGCGREAPAPAAAALPCQNSNNYPPSPYKLRKTVVTCQGKTGQASIVTTSVLTEGSGLDRNGRGWTVANDGETWVRHAGLADAAESKRSFALRRNLESFFGHYGRDHSAFFTLSPQRGMKPRELARRFNDARKRELPWMRSYVRVLEPRRDGTAHHHFAVATDFDMQPAKFDWEAFKAAQEQAPRRGSRPGPQFNELRRRYVESACPELRECWEANRWVCKKYGLGRAEMLPLRKCSEAVAQYVGAYLESGTHYRNREWKGARRVEYDRKESREWKGCGSAFAFVSEGSKEWRLRVGEIAIASCIEPDDFEMMKRTHGRSWAYDMRETIMTASPELWREYLEYLVYVYLGTMPPERKPNLLESC
jgi:hypothetical protein